MAGRKASFWVPKSPLSLKLDGELGEHLLVTVFKGHPAVVGGTSIFSGGFPEVHTDSFILYVCIFP